MTTSTTDADAEAIARIIEDEIDRAANHYFTGGFTERASQIKNVASDTATAILSYLALRREAQEPVAGELLPCPFCGGAAETDSQQAYRNISTGRTETAVAVYCTSCGAQHTICRGDVPDAELSDVTELWNKRAAPPSPVPAPAGEVERLCEAEAVMAKNGKRYVTVFHGRMFYPVEYPADYTDWQAEVDRNPCITKIIDPWTDEVLWPSVNGDRHD